MGRLVSGDETMIKPGGGSRKGPAGAKRSPTEAGAAGPPRGAAGHDDSARQRAEDQDAARLVARFQAGERQAAFSPLYSRYFDRVFAYLRLLYRDEHEAEDAAQQVFLQAFEALPRYQQRGQPFRAWLFVIARNHYLKSLRNAGKVELADTAELNHRRERPGSVEDQLRALTWVSDTDIALFIEFLPDLQRQVILMRFMLDLTVAETAKVLNRSPNQVRVLQHRALTFIRKRLAGVGRVPTTPTSSQPAAGEPTRRRLQQAPVLRYRRFSLDKP